MPESVGKLALDVGGANVKAAHSCGAARVVPFALWRRPEALPRVLLELAGSLPGFGRILLTTTAELCDCFATKREGVRFVANAVASAFPKCRIDVWGTDGRFRSAGGARADPLPCAASNWLALATVVARLAGPGTGLLIDVGSTTTDLVPFRDGRVAARGRTDLERLQNGELVYAGVKRTPLCALADRLPYRGRPTRLMAELFATTLDVFLTTGDLADDPADRETADGRPSTADAARDRLARMVGDDREGFGPADAADLAGSAARVLLERLEDAAREALAGAGFENVGTAVVAGSGEFLASRLADRIPGVGRRVRLSDLWGGAASVAACARALLELDTDREA